jgi:hypothetical protein
LIEIIDVSFPESRVLFVNKGTETIVFDLLWRFFGRHIVADVPDELAACLECGEVQCVEGKFRNCPNRLARVASLKALRMGADRETSVTP